MIDFESRIAWSPEERETFFAAQRRNRLATWRLTTLSYCVAAVLAFAISALFAPLLWGALVIVADLSALVLPVPNIGASAWQWFEKLIAEPMELSKSQILGGIAVAAIPGLSISAVLWTVLRRLLANASVSAAIEELAARVPDRADLDEKQLVNAVDEMAISANVRAPHVFVYPSGPFVNGLAIGYGLEDGAVIVSRGALEQLNRAQTQALAGHLVGSISNGDLRIAGLTVTVQHLSGLLRLISIAAFEPHGRRLLASFVSYARGNEITSKDRAELLSELVAAATMNEKQSQGSLEPAAANRQLNWRDLPKIPLGPAMLIGGTLLPMLTSFLLMPLFALSWRSRCLLADATAVQLTRDPNALTDCLEKIAATGAAAPGPAWLNPTYFAAHQGRAVMGSHPPLPKRLEALRRMGASVERRDRDLAALGLRLAIAGAFAVCFALGGVVVVLLSFVNIALSMFCVLPVVGALHLLLR